MEKKIKRAMSITSSVGMIIIVAVVILLIAVKLIGLEPYTVLSGSMKPTYQVGSIIYVKDVPAEQLEVNDPVTFQMNKTTVATHRIVEINEEEKTFVTKGDNREEADDREVQFSEVIGKPVATIPYLGFLADWLIRSPGRQISLIFCGIVFLLAIVPEIIFKKEKEKE